MKRRTSAKILVSAFFVLLSAGASPGAARTVNIVAFGDSSTAGYLVPRRDAYPAQLQLALRKKGYNVVVKNAGVSGDTTANGLRRFDDAIDPGTDIALVEFGTNDLRLGIPAERMRANLNELIGALRARGVQVLIIGFGGALDFSDLAQTNGALYTQWSLPPGQYRARDGSHFNAKGYSILVAGMFSQVETLMKRVVGKGR
jgi:acyl-CoA thioesterase-1